jgi:magnesium transporter
LYDHTVRVIENTETLQVMLSDMLDVYFSAVSNRLNEVMKILTMIATVFMPLTFIAGIYGMNFKYMPELEWVWGYPAVLLIMAGIGLWMILYFRRKKWI